MTDDEIVVGEVVDEESSLVLAEHVAPVNLFGVSRPEDVIEAATSVANALKAVVVDRGLIANISGKEHPNVEAWTLLGSMLGVYPVVKWVKPNETGDGYIARVEAVRGSDGQVIGAAEASCTRGESRWKNRDDYALRGMAQTRATSRALRGPLGFVMTLAGFEALGDDEIPSSGPAWGAETPSSGGVADPSSPGSDGGDLAGLRNQALRKFGSPGKVVKAWNEKHPAHVIDKLTDLTEGALSELVTA